MKISDIFYVYSGSNLDFGKQTLDNDGINFVSRNSNNNGVIDKVQLENHMAVYKKGDISVSLGGSYLLSCFVQNEDFVTAQNVAVLRPKQSLSDIEKWFYCYSIKLNRFKFSAFGREVNKYLKDIEIPSKIPDWVYSNFITPPVTTNTSAKKIHLDVSKWQPFILTEIFNIKGSKTTKLHDLKEYGIGQYPYITTQAVNNGVAGYYDFYTEEGNVITVDSAVLGYVSYQKNNFSASDHVEILKPKFKLNSYIAIFLCNLLNKEQFRYSYGRKCSQDRLRNTIIKLPATKEGQPDWEFMENYIKSLPYSESL